MRRAVPSIPADTPVGLRRVLEALIEQMQVGSAQRGPALQAYPTIQDLIDMGVLNVDENSPLYASGRQFTLAQSKNWLSSTVPAWVTDNTEPPVPTGLLVVSNTANVVLIWDAITEAVFSNYKQTLVYRASSNNLSSAELIGSTTGNTYVDELPPAGVTYFYWLKHESKSELTSSFNDVNGTPTGNVPAAPTLSSAFSGENIVLSWTTPTSNLAIQYYVISHGATAGANPVGISQSNTIRFRADFLGTRKFWVQAVDINGALGAADDLDVTITAPGQPTVTQALVGGSLAISYSSVQGSLPIAYYEVRHGATFAGGTSLGTTLATRVEFVVNWTGSRTFHVVAVDTAGNVSASAASAFNVSTPSVSVVTAQVIDNNVLLRWTAAQGTLPIKTFNVYRDSVLIGSDPAAFSVIFESAAGNYLYEIEPVDTAGNVGAKVGTTATVAQPPDFVLFNNQQSAFTGTKTSAFFDADTGALYANVDTSETWEQHFTSRGWTSPQDQINAGYPLYLVGKTTGSYEEKVDYGTTIGSSKVTMTPTTYFQSGTVTITPSLATSPDDVSYTTFASVYEAYSTNFRYVKFKMDFAAGHDGTGLATDSSELIAIKPLTYKLDVKLKSAQGVVTCNSGDAGGTTVDITSWGFIDVQAITLTPLSTTAKHPTYDFVDAPNPTQFKAFLWDAAGARVSGDASWTIRGV